MLLQYASLNEYTDSRSVGPSLYRALYNDDLAKKLDFAPSSDSEWYTRSAKMMAAIAYSALYDPSAGGDYALVFGDSAIRALFDDENQLGKLISAQGTADYLKLTAVQDALAQIAVEYAGLLAKNKVTHESDVSANTGYQNGALFVGGTKNLLVGDFSPGLWTKEGAQVDILGKQSLVDAVAQFGGTPLTCSSVRLRHSI